MPLDAWATGPVLRGAAAVLVAVLVAQRYLRRADTNAESDDAHVATSGRAAAGAIPTFVVNLERRPERRSFMRGWLGPLEEAGLLRVTFWAATDAREPEPLEARLARGGYGRFRGTWSDVGLPLSERFNFFSVEDGTLIEDPDALRALDEGADPHFTSEVNSWYGREAADGGVASGHSHLTAWQAAFATGPAPFTLFLEDDVFIAKGDLQEFLGELGRQRAREDAGAAPCDLIYLYRYAAYDLPNRRRYSEMGVLFGQPDGEPDEHGWLTTGYSWMSNAYVLSARALETIAQSNLSKNIMFADDMLPMLTTVNPVRSIAAFFAGSGIGNRLRGCESPMGDFVKADAIESDVSDTSVTR